MKLRIFVVLACLAAIPICVNAKQNQKKAFLMGISSYWANERKSWKNSWHNIHGADDVALLVPILKEQGFEITEIIDEDATKDGIIKALNSFIEKTSFGNIIYMHFSCHGQPVEDGLNGLGKDEIDDWDESIVPIDAQRSYSDTYKGEKHITDDELNIFFMRLRKKMGPSGMLYVIIDACHAGTTARAEATVRGTNEGLSSLGKEYNPSRDSVCHYSVVSSPSLAPVLFIEACKAQERNSEIRVNGKEYGSLSYNVYEALLESPLDKNAIEFRKNVEKSTKEQGRWPRRQHLVVEASIE